MRSAVREPEPAYGQDESSALSLPARPRAEPAPIPRTPELCRNLRALLIPVLQI